MPDEHHPARERSAYIIDVVYHALIYAAVMTILAIIAFVVGNWIWFIASAAGWGIVVIGQAAYVFLRVDAGGDPLLDRDAARMTASGS